MERSATHCPGVSAFERWRARSIAVALGAVLAACAPSDRLAAGRDHMKAEDYPAAVIEFKNAVQADLGAVEPRLLLADALERTHDRLGAEQQLRKAVENGGDENQLVPRIALLMLDRSDIDKLVRDFKDRQLPSAEANSTLHAAVAMAYLSQRRVPLAQAQLEGLAPTPALTVARAQLLAQQGQPKEALALLTATPPDAGTPWWLLRTASRLAAAVDQPQVAVGFIERAHQAVPWHHGVAGEYGEALLGVGKVAQATAVRDGLRKRAPNYFWTVYLDALLLAREGRTEESHAAALRVLSVAPDHAPANLLVASAELQQGDVAAADRRLQSLVQRSPFSLPSLRLYAQSQLRSGKVDGAAEIVQRGLRLEPEDPQLLGVRAEIELARGQRAEAARTLAALVAKRPDDAGALLRLAEVHGSLGASAEAVRRLEQAAAAGKDDTGLQARVVAAALRIGQPALARRLADEGVAAHPDDGQARLTLAATQSAQGDAAGAWASTVAVLDREPANPLALTALSAMARSPEQQRERLARHAAAVAAGARSAQVYLLYAALLRAGDQAVPTPLSVLEKGVATLPAVVPLRQALVEEYLRAGEPDKAVSAAQSGAAVANAPGAAIALLAATNERLGRTQAATEGYRKLAAAYPQRHDWRLHLAQLEAAAGRRAEAITLLRAVLQERPFDVAPYLALATLSLPDNPSEALSIARQMGQREELKGAAMLLEADVLAQTGKPEDALKRYGDAARAGMVPAAQLRMVRVLDQTGQRAAADAELAAALKRHPDDAGVVAAAAQRALAAGQAARSVELLQKLAAKAPGNAVLLNDLAWAQLEAGRPEALETARRAARGLPNNAAVLDTYGLALARAGRQAEAVDTLRTAVNLAPLAPLPRLHLAETLLAGGDRAGAQAALQPADPGRLDAKDKARFDKLQATLGSS